MQEWHSRRVIKFLNFFRVYVGHTFVPWSALAYDDVNNQMINVKMAKSQSCVTDALQNSCIVIPDKR